MILIDNIIFYLQKAGGISVVWKELIMRLNAHTEINYLEYNNFPSNLFYADLRLNSECKIILRLFFLFFQRYLPVRLSGIKSKHIFHSSYYRYSTNPLAVNITTVHDFTYEFYLKGIKAKLHTWQKKKAIRHSDYIICISENTKKDLLNYMPDVDEKRVRVIYNGVSDDYYVIPSELSSYELPFPQKEFVVFIGSRVKYKNFELSVCAISETSYNLVIIGSPLSKKEIEILDDKLGRERYFCSGIITNDILNVFYNNAFALLYPSSYEGFGIPIIEAQKAGCPVIAYNASSVPEIIGDSPLLINSLTIEDILNSFIILEDDEARKLIIDNGICNARRFTWDYMCEQVLTLYKEALDSPKYSS